MALSETFVFENTLIIDDSRMDCFIAEKILGSTGLSRHTHSFLSGMDAFSFLKNQPALNPELIILDIYMPLFAGIDFLEMYKELPIGQRTAKIVVMTSSLNETDLQHYRDHPSVSGVISKPLTTSLLVMNAALFAKDPAPAL
ncbi:MAG: response regulator [Chitinophagaceae bacterium]|nr:MAG: response regulator [Chitinophagaceae bacterium]